MKRFNKVWKIVIRYVDSKGVRKMFVELCDNYSQCLQYLKHYSAKYKVYDHEIEKVVM